MSPFRRRLTFIVLGTGFVVVGVCVFFLITDFETNRSLLFTAVGVTVALTPIAYAYRRDARPVPPDQQPRRAAQ